MSTLTKVCVRCKSEKPLTQFYVRSGCKSPTEPGHYNSECKDCLKERSKTLGYIPATMPRAETETYAIKALNRNGIHALPGKAVKATDVDVVAWGCVWIEVKYAKLRNKIFTFTTTPKQIQRGFLAHVVMLICDYGDIMTYHLFNADDPVFYIEEQYDYDVKTAEPLTRSRIKNGFNYVPGRYAPQKHYDNRVVMVDSMMKAAQDRWELVEQWRVYLGSQLAE